VTTMVCQMGGKEVFFWLAGLALLAWDLISQGIRWE
jgi:hypothetical protein